MSVAVGDTQDTAENQKECKLPQKECKLPHCPALVELEHEDEEFAGEMNNDFAPRGSSQDTQSTLNQAGSSSSSQANASQEGDTDSASLEATPALSNANLQRLEQRIAVHLNDESAENKDNLRQILDIPATGWDWNKQQFNGEPGAGIIPAIEAALEEGPLHKAAERIDLRHSHGKDIVLMSKVLQHLVCREAKDRPNAEALKRPNNILIHPQYRLMLVDWLIEVVHLWKLRPQTLHRAVIYVDSFFTNTSQFVVLNAVQLIGVTCLMLACKMEEIEQLPVSYFSGVTDHTYTINVIKDMELQVVQNLGFRLSAVTICDFIFGYLDVLDIQQDDVVERVCVTLGEVSLHDSVLVAEKPSLVAMSCIALGLHMCGMNFSSFWKSWMRKYFLHTRDQHQACLDHLHKLWDAYLRGTLNATKLTYALRQVDSLPYAVPCRNPQPLVLNY